MGSSFSLELGGRGLRQPTQVVHVSEFILRSVSLARTVMSRDEETRISQGPIVLTWRGEGRAKRDKSQQQTGHDGMFMH